jgi:hypothetical protein
MLSALGAEVSRKRGTPLGYGVLPPLSRPGGLTESPGAVAVLLSPSGSFSKVTSLFEVVAPLRQGVEDVLG